MDNIIDMSIPVAEVVDKHPEVLEILVELGFKPLANPLMRNTVGRKVSLKQGSKLEGTPYGQDCPHTGSEWLRSDWIRLMADERIHILRDILLELQRRLSRVSSGAF